MTVNTIKFDFFDFSLLIYMLCPTPDRDLRKLIFSFCFHGFCCCCQFVWGSCLLVLLFTAVRASVFYFPCLTFLRNTRIKTGVLFAIFRRYYICRKACFPSISESLVSNRSLKIVVCVVHHVLSFFNHLLPFAISYP